MINSHKSKNVLILASSKGIGFAIAKLLASHGHNIIISSANKKNLFLAKNKIFNFTQKNVQSVELNLNSNSIQTALKKIMKIFSNRIDVLILNSPGPRYVEISKIKKKEIKKILNTLLYNQIKIILEILPKMKKNRFGRIINLSSTLAKEPSSGMSLSTLFRSSLMSFCKCISLEYGKFGITSNTILTGGVLTDRFIKLLKAKNKKELKKK